MATSTPSLRRARVVVLPDVYTDVLVPVPPWAATSKALDAIAARGGGNLPVGPVEVKLGGNAANLAFALARLGATVDLVANTDARGHRLLQAAAKGTRLRLDRVRVGPEGSTTVALESPQANVMLSHAGPLAAFGPEALEAEDWDAIAEADAVAVVNWAQNRHGTRLLSAIAGRVGSGTFLFFDAGDPRHRPDAGALAKPAGWWAKVGAFGVNRNELSAFVGRELAEADVKPAARELSRRLGTRIDFHCRAWAASVEGDEVVQAKALAPKGRRATGAGDAWNAGNLAGQLLGLEAKERLRLAHRVATLYVTGDDGLPPLAQAAFTRPVPTLVAP